MYIGCRYIVAHACPRVGSTVREVPFGAPPDHECWCPAGATVSPGLDAVSVLLRYQSGIVAGTAQKSRPVVGNPTALVVYDRESGAARHRVALPAGEDHVWSLLADTGDGILVRRHGASSSSSTPPRVGLGR